MKLIYLFLCFFLCVSCKSKESASLTELQKIKLKDIFEINYTKYIIIFYSPTCTACINALEVLNKRMEIQKYWGFCVDLNNEEIDFTKEKVGNINKTNYKDLLFSSVPYLIYIEEKVIVKEIYGYTNIQKENLYIFFE